VLAHRPFREPGHAGSQGRLLGLTVRPGSDGLDCFADTLRHVEESGDVMLSRAGLVIRGSYLRTLHCSLQRIPLDHGHGGRQLDQAVTFGTEA